VLQWARANGCAWNAKECTAWAEDHPAVLQWVRANYGPEDDDDDEQGEDSEEEEESESESEEEEDEDSEEEDKGGF
jgi:hypothetical protein